MNFLRLGYDSLMGAVLESREYGGAVMKKFSGLSEFAVLAFLLCSSHWAMQLNAQSTFASLRGLTLDVTGSAVPGAEIHIQGLDDNSEHQVTSSDDGIFEIQNLKPGRYRITGRKPGFADALVPQLTLEARQDLRVNLTFSVASQNQTVEVSAVRCG